MSEQTAAGSAPPAGGEMTQAVETAAAPEREEQEVGAQPLDSAQDRHAAPAPVREAQFASLPGAAESAAGPSVNMIMDLEVDLSAELGRTAMLIRDLMELHPGSIIELRKVVGEPVDLLANGKVIARGEVVVVDESFGVRVTEVVRSPVRVGGTV